MWVTARCFPVFACTLQYVYVCVDMCEWRVTCVDKRISVSLTSQHPLTCLSALHFQPMNHKQDGQSQTDRRRKKMENELRSCLEEHACHEALTSPFILWLPVTFLLSANQVYPNKIHKHTARLRWRKAKQTQAAHISPELFYFQGLVGKQRVTITAKKKMFFFFKPCSL